MVNECLKLNHDKDSYIMILFFVMHEVKINKRFEWNLVQDKNTYIQPNVDIQYVLYLAHEAKAQKLLNS